MTPTFIFIMWMCTTPSASACPIWDSTKHMVIIEPEADRRACEAQWIEANTMPDPDGLKSYHRCQPIGEDL